MKHGLKLKNVHQVIMFENTSWLKPYIIWNTKLKTDGGGARHKFERIFSRQ